MSYPESDKDPNRIPRGAIAVVVVGVLLSLAIYGIGIRGGGSSAEVKWQVVEKIVTPEQASKAGKNGELNMRRTTISALPPNGGGQSIFRIGGVAVVDSGKLPTTVVCAVDSIADDTTIARTPNLRAAWPRPSDELQAQEVPESMVLKFNQVGNSILGVPIRDVINRYTNSASPTMAGWDTDVIGTQKWTWTMDKGSGPGPATLGYVVVFRTLTRPKADIDCSAKIGGETVSQRAEARLQDWPLVAEDTDAVETDPELDVE